MTDERRKSQRHEASESLPVFDYKTNEPIGELVNMSVDGIMIVADQSLKQSNVYDLYIRLDKQIMGHRIIRFKAECRWCRRNVSEARWEAGFQISLTGVNEYLMQFVGVGFDLCGWGDDTVRNVKTVDMASRRATTRYELKRPLKVFELPNQDEIGAMTNFSIGGVGMMTTKPFESGATLFCQVKLPKTILGQSMMALNLKCARCRPITDGRAYDVGFEIVKAGKETASIMAYLMIHFALKQATTKKIAIVR